MPGGGETGEGEGQGRRRGSGGGESVEEMGEVRGGGGEGETAGEGRRTKRRIEEVEGAVAGRLELPAGPADRDDTQVNEREADGNEAARASEAREGQGRTAWGFGEVLTGVMRSVTEGIGSLWGAVTGKRGRGEGRGAEGAEKRRRTGDG